jgi:riboflavin synthase
MFTGLIESVGRIAALTSTDTGGITVRVTTSLAPELRPGDSVAVNGVCLTVTRIDGDAMHADIGPETARVTTLGALRHEDGVNLERPVRADSRFGGHFVQGHVDGRGVVAAVRADGDAHWVTIGFSSYLAPYLVPKGSIAVDGISLTIAGLRDGQFDVMIIPFTWTHTTMSSLRAGDSVNLECDMIGKYVVRSLEVAGIRSQESGIRAGSGNRPSDAG